MPPQAEIPSIRPSPEALRQWAPEEVPEMHEEVHKEDLLLPPPSEEKEVVFDKTVQAPRDFPQMREEIVKVERVLPSKSFVSVADYKKIVSESNVIRSRLMNADNFVKKLVDLKAEEERALERWRSQLEDVEKKLAYVDQLVEKAQR